MARRARNPYQLRESIPPHVSESVGHLHTQNAAMECSALHCAVVCIADVPSRLGRAARVCDTMYLLLVCAEEIFVAQFFVAYVTEHSSRVGRLFPPPGELVTVCTLAVMQAGWHAPL